MGIKNRYLILLILLVSPVALAQEKDFIYFDSLTYSYYKAGEWDKLIQEGEKALKTGIDYKFLRQRLGYAWFLKSDYFRSGESFKKALEYDSYDQFTLEYLYYVYLHTGREDYTGYLKKAMFPDLRKTLEIPEFRPVESIETEFNYKLSGSNFRSDAAYYRIGLSSRLGYRIRLYQSFSGYSQSISAALNETSAQFRVKQPEYFVQLNFNITPSSLIRCAYHYLNTQSGEFLFKGHMFHIGFAPDLKRFILEINSSMINYEEKRIYQPEIHGGYRFPGKTAFYLKGSVAYLAGSGNNFVYSPKAGIELLKDTWIEGHAAFGRMDFYNDFNGLYIYNSYDPMILKSGASILHYFNERVLLWFSFAIEEKEYYNYIGKSFNQYSCLGGIKWKI